MEPVTLQEIKSACRIDQDSTSEDDDLMLMAGAARELLEKQLNIGLVPQELELQFDGRKMELPMSPTIRIISVKDSAGEDVAYSTDNYQAKSIWVDQEGSLLGNWEYWPNNGYVEFTPYSNGKCEMYTVRYETGYETLPYGLKNALLLQVSYLYLTRGEPVSSPISQNALQLARQYSRNLVL